MEGHPFRFISLCGRVFIELNPRCYQKLVPKGLVGLLALGIKTRSIDVLLESSALHQKIVHQATQMLSSDQSFNSFHAAGTNRRPDFSLSWGFDLSSTNKSAIPLRHSLFPRHSVFSFVFFLPQLSGTSGRNRLFYPPTLSGYNWSLHNYFSLGTTQLISWPDRERYSCTPQALVVSLIHSHLFSDWRPTISFKFFDIQVPSVFTEQLVLRRHTRYAISYLGYNGHNLPLLLPF